MIVIDTSVVLAFMNRRDSAHEAVSEWMGAAEGLFVTTPLAVAEMDHLILARGGPAAAAALHEDLQAGAYEARWWPGAIEQSITIARRYASLGLSLTDASLVALAREVRTTQIATLDERNFRDIRPLSGEDAYVLLPADAG